MPKKRTATEVLTKIPKYDIMPMLTHPSTPPQSGNAWVRVVKKSPWGVYNYATQTGLWADHRKVADSPFRANRTEGKKAWIPAPGKNRDQKPTRFSPSNPDTVRGQLFPSHGLIRWEGNNLCYTQRPPGYSAEVVLNSRHLSLFSLHSLCSFFTYLLIHFMFPRPDQRVAIFIDTQNMYHSAKHMFSAKVNFPALVETAADNRRIIRAIAYVAKSKTGEEQAFFDALMQNGIELKIKDVQEFSSGAKKADWDVGMTVDAIAIAARVDTIILVTGDGDFVPLVHYLQSLGVRTEVVGFGESTSASLRDVADAFIDVSAEPDLFLIRAHNPRQRVSSDEQLDDLPDLGTHAEPRRPNPKKSMPPRENESKSKRNIRISY